MSPSLEFIEICLSSYNIPLGIIISMFYKYVVDHPHVQQIKVGHGEAYLRASKQEQTSSKRSFTYSVTFFLGFDVVISFSRHSSIICGKTEYIENISKLSSHSSAVSGMVSSA